LQALYIIAALVSKQCLSDNIHIEECTKGDRLGLGPERKER
jgi:hypothetical protein